MLGNTPVKKMMIHNDTQDATMVASDLQAGVTCYAKGQKVTGTGKAFSFASYGGWKTNFSDIIPMVINTILISSTEYPVKMTVPTNKMVTHDFTTAQKMAEVIVNGVTYPIIVSVLDGELMIDCEKTINLEIFIGKDEYA
jgi:hypothetical protein